MGKNSKEATVGIAEEKAKEIRINILHKRFKMTAADIEAAALDAMRMRDGK